MGQPAVNTGEAYEFSFTESERRVFKAKEDLTVSEHAEKFREVTRGPWPGPWKNENTEYCRFPMDLFNQPWVRRIYMCWAPQTGKTQVAANCLNYVIDQDPDTAFYVMASGGTLKRIAKRQLIPMFRAHRRIARLLSSRADDTSMLSVSFKNGMDLLLAWASSVSALASESARYMFFDEVDKYWPRINLSLGDQRTNAYPYTKKLLYFTTPEDEAAPITQMIRHEADVLYLFHALCPMCGHGQRMEFDSIRWPSDIRDFRKVENKKIARYVCSSCGNGWGDNHRDLAVRRGGWLPYHHDNKWPDGKVEPMAPEEVPQRPENVALHLPAWYSPFVSLSECAGMFLRGLGDPDKLQIFVTQYKAQPWKQTVTEKTEDKILAAKVKNLPAQHAPETAVALTCGVDVQKYGFWFLVRAWARDYTNWKIHHGFVNTWAEIEDLLFMREYPRIGGGPGLRIWRAGFDTGGGKYQEERSSAEEVYFWITKNRGRGCQLWPTKGASRPLAAKVSIGKALERAPSGKAIPGGVQIISLDTNKLKDLYHFRIEKAMDGGGPMSAYLDQDTGRDYARQILAEVKEKQKNGAELWVQKHRDNHLLDCEVIAQALADPEWPGGGVHLLSGPGADELEEGLAEAQDGSGQGARDGGRRRPDWFMHRRGR